MLVQCYSGCEKMAKFLKFTNHTHWEVYEQVLIGCKYEQYGCDTDILRKDVPEHEEDLKLHLEIALQTN